MGYVVGPDPHQHAFLANTSAAHLYTAYQRSSAIRFAASHRSPATLFYERRQRRVARLCRIHRGSIALGTGEVSSIANHTLLTLIYTFEGGLAAVIWTDVVQTFHLY